MIERQICEVRRMLEGEKKILIYIYTLIFYAHLCYADDFEKKNKRHAQYNKEIFRFLSA